MRWVGWMATPRWPSSLRPAPLLLLLPARLAWLAIYVPGKTPADLWIPEGAGYAEAAFQDGGAASTCGFVDPAAGVGPTSIITRAESAAILAALQNGSAIATDSATVMYQIRNAIMRPMTMRRHKNVHMVQAPSLRQRQPGTGRSVSTK